MSTSTKTKPETEILKRWLRATVKAMGHGGNAKAAKLLGIGPSAVSKLVGTGGQGFNEKTVKAIAWMETSKAERFVNSGFPVIKTEKVDGLVYETRQITIGNTFVTWKHDVKGEESE